MKQTAYIPNSALSRYVLPTSVSLRGCVKIYTRSRYSEGLRPGDSKASILQEQNFTSKDAPVCKSRAALNVKKRREQNRGLHYKNVIATNSLCLAGRLEFQCKICLFAGRKTHMYPYG